MGYLSIERRLVMTCPASRLRKHSAHSIRRLERKNGVMGEALMATVHMSSVRPSSAREGFVTPSSKITSRIPTKHCTIQVYGHKGSCLAYLYGCTASRTSLGISLFGITSKHNFSFFCTLITPGNYFPLYRNVVVSLTHEFHW